MRVSLLVSCALIWLAASAVAEERVEIRIDGAGARDLQVAVQRFDADPASQSDVDEFYEELTKALEFGGSLLITPPTAFLGPERTGDFSNESIVCDNWRGIGTDILVQGRIERYRGQGRVRYRIWDVGRCRLQGDRGYLDAPVDSLWLAARRLADEVVYRFTGRRGVSSTQIAFVSDRKGNKEIQVMESDGTRRRAVTRNGRINLFPDWSENGKTLLYTSYKGGRSDLWLLSRGSNPGRRLLEAPGEKYRGVFGPLRDQVTLVMNRGGNTDLFVGRHDGRGIRRLTRNRAIDVSPSWSPDGTKVAFASDRSGTQQIYVMDISTNTTRRITFRGGYNASPAWSPTGEWIVYAARTGANLDLYLIEPETGYTTPVVIHPRSDEDPAWSPDGRKIVFSSSRRGRRDLFVIDVDGRNLRRITSDYGNCSNPAWSGWLD
jgi:TolB protein